MHRSREGTGVGGYSQDRQQAWRLEGPSTRHGGRPTAMASTSSSAMRCGPGGTACTARCAPSSGARPRSSCAPSSTGATAWSTRGPTQTLSAYSRHPPTSVPPPSLRRAGDGTKGLSSVREPQRGPALHICDLHGRRLNALIRERRVVPWQHSVEAHAVH